jgi:branched-chain amino acid transport system substrate-binding protein
MSFVARRLAAFSTATILLAAFGSSALAQKKYDTGATDTEIKIGNIMPYSGPASAWGVVGKTEAAYFRKINAEGGINGARSLSFLMTTPTVHQKQWNRRASWSKVMRFS